MAVGVGIGGPHGRRDSGRYGINSASKAASATKWSGISVIMTSASQLLTVIVLARIVDAHEIGLVAVVNIFYSFIDIFIGLGLTAALIQRRQVTSRELSSVHWANIAIAAIAFGAISLLSRPIAGIFGAPDAYGLIIVSALAFLFTAVGQASRAVLEKRLDFRPLGIADSLFALVSFAVAVVLALLGYGAMSAAIGLALGALARTVVFMVCARRIVRFRWHFRFSDTGRFFGYGVWQSVDGVLNYVSNTLATISTGRFVSVAALGGFNLAYNIGISIPSRVGPTVTRVLFPYFSLIQHDRKRVEQDYLRMLTLLGLSTGPALACIAVVASDVMRVVFGPTWESYGPVLAILCIAGWIRALGYPIGSLLAATDNIKLGVHLNFWRTVVNVPLILGMTLVWGVEGAGWSMVVMAVVSYFLGYWCLRKVTGARFEPYVRATIPAFTSVVLPVLAVFALGWLLPDTPVLVRLALQVIAGLIGLVVYVNLSRDPSTRYFTNVARTIIARKARHRVAVVLPVDERYDGTGGAVASWVRNAFSAMEDPLDYAVYCPAGGGDFAGGTPRVRMPLYDALDRGARALTRVVGRVTGKNPNGIMRVLNAGGRFWVWSLFPWISTAEIIHVHNEPSYVVRLRRMGYRGKIILHMHNEVVGPIRSLTEGRRAVTSVTELESEIDAWVFCSRFLADQAREELSLSVPLGVVHNGSTFTDATASLHSPGRPVRLAFAGRLIEDKGVVEAVAAAGALAVRMPVILDIFGGKAPGKSSGESPYTRRVRAAADEVNTTHPDSTVRVRGFVEPEVLADELAQCDLFVYPCLWEEPFGMVILDAMSVGTPVVATTRGGIPEILSPDSGGALVPATATAAQIATAMESMLLDPEYPARRRAAHAVAVERFSWRRISQSLREVFDSVS